MQKYQKHQQDAHKVLKVLARHSHKVSEVLTRHKQESQALSTRGTWSIDPSRRFLHQVKWQLS